MSLTAATNEFLALICAQAARYVEEGDPEHPITVTIYGAEIAMPLSVIQQMMTALDAAQERAEKAREGKRRRQPGLFTN